jgi:hypothetical protein
LPSLHTDWSLLKSWITFAIMLLSIALINLPLLLGITPWLIISQSRYTAPQTGN